MSTEKTTNGTSTTNGDSEMQIKEHLDLAERAYALRKYEEAADQYSDACELYVTKHGDASTEYADLLYKYGKALLENGRSKANVLGKTEPPVDASDDAPAENDADGKIHFSGDAEEAEDEEEDDASDDEEDGDVIMEGQEEVKLEDVGKIDGEDEDEEMADAQQEPEDDFHQAWEIFETARRVYEKQEDDQSKLKLADTFTALGDISLETEKFDQAAEDYMHALKMKVALLPTWHRAIAEAHFSFAIVADLSLGKLASAIEHAELARQSLEDRLAFLAKVSNRDATGATEAATNGTHGSASLTAMEKERINQMTKDELAIEIKDVEEMKGEVALKIEELKTSPEIDESAPDAANRALDEILGGPSASLDDAPVNDLTTMVKKKKPVKADTEAPAVEATA